MPILAYAEAARTPPFDPSADLAPPKDHLSLLVRCCKPLHRRKCEISHRGLRGGSQRFPITRFLLRRRDPPISIITFFGDTNHGYSVCRSDFRHTWS